MSVAAITLTARKAKELDRVKTPLRGVCLLVTAPQQPVANVERFSARDGRDSFPQRPNPQALSETIPLYFIARNKSGFWIAREAEGRTGGIFLFQSFALRFAKKTAAPGGCATMFLPQCFELDVPNRGWRITARLSDLIGRLSSLIPDHPPAIRIRREIFTKGNK